MGMSLKQAVKSLRNHTLDQAYFGWIDKDASGDPVVLAEKSKIDPKKHDEFAGLLKTATGKLHAVGFMALLPATSPKGNERLVLQPMGTGINTRQLELGFEKLARQAGINDLDIEVGKVRAKEKGSEFEDEDTSLSFRATNPADRGKDGFVTGYAQDPATSRATTQDGRLKDAGGRVVDGKDKGFVIDPKTGAVHLFDQKVEVEDTSTGQRRVATQADLPPNALAPGLRLVATHHSTPLAGRAVAGAGELEASQGRVTKITDKSGHYKPDGELTHQGVQAMKDAGVGLVDDTPAALNQSGRQRRATAEEARDVRTLQDYRKSQGLADKVSLGERLKLQAAQVKAGQIQQVDPLLVDMVKLEQKLRATGAGASQTQAKVELGGKGLTEEEFAVVKGDKDKINLLMRKKYGVETVLYDPVDPADLNSLLRLNNLLVKMMPKATLGAETYLGTGGGEKTIRAKPALNTSVKQLVSDDDWAQIRGDRDRINAYLRRRIGHAEFLPANTTADKLDNRALINLVIARGAAALAAGDRAPKVSKRGDTAVDDVIKTGQPNAGPLDTGMPDGWKYNGVMDADAADQALGLTSGTVQDWVDGGDVDNMEDLAGKVALTVAQLYTRLTGKQP